MMPLEVSSNRLFALIEIDEQGEIVNKFNFTEQEFQDKDVNLNEEYLLMLEEGDESYGT